MGLGILGTPRKLRSKPYPPKNKLTSSHLVDYLEVSSFLSLIAVVAHLCTNLEIPTFCHIRSDRKKIKIIYLE